MDNLLVEKVEGIVEKDGKMTGKDFLQKCQLLEDVETSMYQNKKENFNTNIKYRYSKEELLKLRTHPLSTKPPSLQENLKFLLGTSKPKDREENDIKKNLLKKHGLTRNLDGVSGEKFDLKKNDGPRNGEKLNITRNEEIDETRKSADPKERIRKEQDICLSPQRKSFTTGCYVANVKSENITNNNNNNNNTNNKTNTENTGRENRENRETRDNREIREIRDNRDNRDTKNFREGSRRIGSGRIISRDPRFEIRGYPESSSSFSDYQYNRSYNVNKEIPTVVYERRFQMNSFDREKDNKFWDRQRTYNYYDKRRSHDHRDDDEEEEPEWMKEGPVSLDDVIELKGFDENDEKSFRNNRNSKINTRVFHKLLTNNSSNKSPTMTNGRNRNDKRNSDSDNSSIASDSLNSKQNENSTNKSNENTSEKQKNEGKAHTNEEKDTKNVENSIQFNLEEILKLDPLPDISENVDNESAGSKFTRWFKRDEVPSNIINGEQNSVLKNTSPRDMMKAPTIGDPNVHALNNQVSSGSNLLELLRGSQENSAGAAKIDVRVLEATGKLHSVEEIEAKLRGTDNNTPNNGNTPNDKKKKEEETEAFKKLLSQAFHVDKGHNEDHLSDGSFSQKSERNNNIDGKMDSISTACNGENHVNLSSNAQPHVSRLPHLNNMQQSSEMLKLFQMQQNKQQQELLSKMLMSSPSSTFSVPPPSNARPSNGTPNIGSLLHVAPEIQIMINSVQPTRELMQRPETVNILRALKSGEVSQFQLVEQLKKLTPYQAKFRESLLCVLKLIQMQYYNSASLLGSPAGIPFNIPPPLPAAQPYTENVLQQMVLNSQYRVNGPHTGMPNIVYQRDFPSPNQNVFQNNVIKKHLTEQSTNIGQNVARMGSPTTVLSSPISVSVSGNNITNATNSIIPSHDDKSNAAIPNKITSTSQSLPFTPTSVLRKLSAEKENLDTFSKEVKESKDASMSLAGYTNQNLTARNAPMNGTLSSAEEQMARWFSSDGVSQSRNLIAQNVGLSGASLQNMMSVEEIERVQQSVRN